MIPPPKPVAVAAPFRDVAATPGNRTTPPPAPFDTPVEPPPDRSARSDVIASPPVEVPPPPRFAASFWFRLLKKVTFWRPPADVVQLTVFGPPRAVPGETVKLQVFAHQPAAFESVCTLSRAFHQDGDLLASGYVNEPVARGAELGLHLSVAKAGVARSLLQLNWLGQPQPRSFEVHIPWESPPGLTVGVLSAGLNGVLAGRVEFHVQVAPRKG